MKAAVYYGPRDIRFEDVPMPVAGPGEIVVAVSRNGICGSDVHTYIGSSTGGAAMHLPGVVLGHEFAGAVHQLGSGVDDLAIGDVVAVAPLDYCGTCWSCTQPWPHMCRRLALYGGYRRPLHGGLAPYVKVSRSAAFRVPVGLGANEAALTEPLAVALHAARRAPSISGATVMVLGAGPIGLGVLQAVIGSGCGPTIVSEISTARRAAARRLGATAVIDPTVDDIKSVVRDLTGHGIDVVFDTTASSAALAQGISSLRPRGTLVSVAGWQEPATIDMGRAMVKEIDIRFSMTYEPAVDFPATMAMLADGRFDAGAMISDHIPLERLVDGGLEELIHHADRHLKILVDPSA
jgi:(R,R)-butanediol dehydrogenase / meso-butanediol dehydrogenase / diacetyl reductase